MAKLLFPRAPVRSSIDSQKLIAACQEFRRAMRITAGARFNASKRLADHDKRLNIAVAILSCYIIAITVFQVARPLEETANQYMTFLCIVLSVGVLVLALLQYASSDAVHSEQHHRCALEIEEIRRSVDIFILNPALGDLREAVDRYNEVLANSNLNHDEDDRLLYIVDRPDLDFGIGPWAAVWIKVRVWLKAQVSTFIIAAFGVGVVWLIFFYALNHIKQ